MVVLRLEIYAPHTVVMILLWGFFGVAFKISIGVLWMNHLFRTGGVLMNVKGVRENVVFVTFVHKGCQIYDKMR